MSSSVGINTGLISRSLFLAPATTMKVLVLAALIGAALARPDVSHLNAGGYQHKSATYDYKLPATNYALPAETYGVPFREQKPHTTYGVPSTGERPAGTYGVPHTSYGVPSKDVKPAGTYGVPHTSYGVPSRDEKPAGTYGVPHTSYGVPPQDVKPAGTYGVPLKEKPAETYGPPLKEVKPAGTYGVPLREVKPAGTYGVPLKAVKPAITYGVPFQGERLDLSSKHGVISYPTTSYGAPLQGSGVASTHTRFSSPTTSYGAPLQPSVNYLPGGLQLPLADSHVNFLGTPANDYGLNTQVLEERKHVYFFAADEEQEPTKLRIYLAPNNQRNTNVIFVKAPSYAAVVPEVVAHPQQGEEKTKIFVLVKKPEEHNAFNIETPASVKSKPEVYVVKYNNQHDIEQAISGGRSGSPLGSNVHHLGDEQAFIQFLHKGSQVQLPHNDKYSGFDGNINVFQLRNAANQGGAGFTQVRSEVSDVSPFQVASGVPGISSSQSGSGSVTTSQVESQANPVDSVKTTYTVISQGQPQPVGVPESAGIIKTDQITNTASLPGGFNLDVLGTSGGSGVSADGRVQVQIIRTGSGVSPSGESAGEASNEVSGSAGGFLGVRASGDAAQGYESQSQGYESQPQGYDSQSQGYDSQSQGYEIKTKDVQEYTSPLIASLVEGGQGSGASSVVINNSGDSTVGVGSDTSPSTSPATVSSVHPHESYGVPSES